MIVLEKYISLEFEVIQFEEDDVITTSDLGNQEDYVKTVKGNDLSDKWGE